MSAAHPPARVSVRADQAAPPAEVGEPAGWGVWLAWTWVLVLLTAAVAELGGIDDLRLALDVQRHFVPER